MFKKQYQKIVSQIIEKIENLESDIEIEDFLKSKGYNADKRHLIMKIVEEEIKSTETEGYNANFDNKEKKKEVIDDKFLDEIEDQEIRARNTGVIMHKHVPVITLLTNSFLMLFGNLPKYLILFIAHLVIPILIYAISLKFPNSDILAVSNIIFTFAFLIFFISLAKFIGDDNDGYLFAIKFSLANFIPIFFTLALVATIIITLASIGEIISIFGNNILIYSVRILFLLASIIFIIWYSLALFVMVNEEEYYLNSIAKSRKYIKNGFSNYVAKLGVLFLIFILLFASLFGIFSLFEFPFMNLILFSYVFIAMSDNPNTIIAMVAILFAILLISSWVMVFCNLLYQDFAMTANYSKAPLSNKHQNIFFILLVLAPFIMNSSVLSNIYYDSKIGFNIDTNTNFDSGFDDDLDDNLNKVFEWD